MPIASLFKNNMEGNKDEAEKCLSFAKKFALNGNIEKAIKFLNKSIKLYPTEKAEGKLHIKTGFIAPNTLYKLNRNSFCQVTYTLNYSLL